MQTTKINVTDEIRAEITRELQSRNLAQSLTSAESILNTIFEKLNIGKYTTIIWMPSTIEELITELMTKTLCNNRRDAILSITIVFQLLGLTITSIPGR